MGPKELQIGDEVMLTELARMCYMGGGLLLAKAIVEYVQ